MGVKSPGPASTVLKYLRGCDGCLCGRLCEPCRAAGGCATTPGTVLRVLPDRVVLTDGRVFRRPTGTAPRPGQEVLVDCAPALLSRGQTQGPTPRRSDDAPFVPQAAWYSDTLPLPDREDRRWYAVDGQGLSVTPSRWDMQARRYAVRGDPDPEYTTSRPLVVSNLTNPSGTPWVENYEAQRQLSAPGQWFSLSPVGSALGDALIVSTPLDSGRVADMDTGALLEGAMPSTANTVTEAWREARLLDGAGQPLTLSYRREFDLRVRDAVTGQTRPLQPSDQGSPQLFWEERDFGLWLSGSVSGYLNVAGGFRWPTGLLDSQMQSARAHAPRPPDPATVSFPPPNENGVIMVSAIAQGAARDTVFVPLPTGATPPSPVAIEVGDGYLAPILSAPDGPHSFTASLMSGYAELALDGIALAYTPGETSTWAPLRLPDRYAAITVDPSGAWVHHVSEDGGEVERVSLLPLVTEALGRPLRELRVVATPGNATVLHRAHLYAVTDDPAGVDPSGMGWWVQLAPYDARRALDEAGWKAAGKSHPPRWKPLPPDAPDGSPTRLHVSGVWLDGSDYRHFAGTRLWTGPVQTLPTGVTNAQGEGQPAALALLQTPIDAPLTDQNIEEGPDRPLSTPLTLSYPRPALDSRLWLRLRQKANLSVTVNGQPVVLRALTPHGHTGWVTYQTDLEVSAEHDPDPLTIRANTPLSRAPLMGGVPIPQEA